MGTATMILNLKNLNIKPTLEMFTTT